MLQVAGGILIAVAVLWLMARVAPAAGLIGFAAGGVALGAAVVFYALRVIAG